MKNFSTVLNVVLAAAVIVLYVLYFTGRCDKGQNEQAEVTGSGVVDSKIVYINTDSLIGKYQLAKDMTEEYLKKQEDRRVVLNQEAKKVAQEMENFQKKAQNNGFISQARYEEAGRAIEAMQQKLQRTQQELAEQSRQEEEVLNKKLFESITTFLKEYNKQRGYEIILGGNVLISKDGLNITDEVVDMLNKNYNIIKK